MIVTKEFEFDAAHRLLNFHGKCEQLHGHRWKLQVSIEAAVGENGIAFDFVELNNLVNKRIIDTLDHSYLNDLLAQPSTENIALWVWDHLQDLPLQEVRVWESPTSSVTYRGPQSQAPA